MSARELAAWLLGILAVVALFASSPGRCPMTWSRPPVILRPPPHAHAPLWRLYRRPGRDPVPRALFDHATDRTYLLDTPGPR